MTEIEKMQKLLELAKENPEKLEGLLAKMEQPAEVEKPLSKKARIKREVFRSLSKSLGSGFTKFFPDKER